MIKLAYWEQQGKARWVLRTPNGELAGWVKYQSDKNTFECGALDAENNFDYDQARRDRSRDVFYNLKDAQEHVNNWIINVRGYRVISDKERNLL